LEDKMPRQDTIRWSIDGGREIGVNIEVKEDICEKKVVTPLLTQLKMMRKLKPMADLKPEDNYSVVIFKIFRQKPVEGVLIYDRGCFKVYQNEYYGSTCYLHPILPYRYTWNLGRGTPTDFTCARVEKLLYVKKLAKKFCIGCGKYQKAKDLKLGVCRGCRLHNLTYKCTCCGKNRRKSKIDAYVSESLCPHCTSKLPRCHMCGRLAKDNKIKFNTGERACVKCKASEYHFKYGRYVNFYKMAYEKKQDNFIGFELELEARGDLRVIRNGYNKSDYLVRPILRIVEYLGLKFHIGATTDGSLSDGIEFQSNPCTYDYLRKNFKLKKLLSHIYKYMRSTYTCGLHFHLSRKTIPNQDITKMMLFMAINWEWILPLSGRERTKYCSPVPREQINVLKDTFPEEKYQAVHPCKETVEIRIFQAPKDYETFVGYLQFVELLRIFVRLNSKTFFLKNRVNEFKQFAKERGFNYLLKLKNA